jgi:hypothetical protein
MVTRTLLLGIVCLILNFNTVLADDLAAGRAVGLELMTMANIASSGEVMVDRLVYRLSAGPPGERLSVNLLVPRVGDARLNHLDELYGLAASERAITPEEDWRLRILGLAGEVEKADQDAEILPDGLVRQFEIIDDHGRTTLLTTGLHPPPTVRQLVETLDAWLADEGVRLDQDCRSGS